MRGKCRLAKKRLASSGQVGSTTTAGTGDATETITDIKEKTRKKVVKRRRRNRSST